MKEIRTILLVSVFLFCFLLAKGKTKYNDLIYGKIEISNDNYTFESFREFREIAFFSIKIA